MIKSDPVMAGFCHCLSCQKLSGAGHAFHVMIPEADFSVTGQTKGYSRKADSGNMVTTYFWVECGAPIFGRSTGFPGTVTVRAASLDHPESVTPQMTVFAKRVQPWDRADPALPAFPAMPPMPGG